MEKTKKLLNKKFNKNTVVLKHLKSNIFDTKSYLHVKDSLIFKECNNLEIIIDSVINRLEFIKCNDIKIKVYKLISGLSLEKCDNIEIEGDQLNSVIISRSFSIKINSDKDIYFKELYDSKQIEYV